MYYCGFNVLNPFKPECTFVIFIHYKTRIAIAILDLSWMKMICCGLNIEENYHVSVNQFTGFVRIKTPSCRKIRCVFRDVKWCFIASGKGLQGAARVKRHISVQVIRKQHAAIGFETKIKNMCLLWKVVLMRTGAVLSQGEIALRLLSELWKLQTS